jgi:formamidopyrimidine-DNA glycosylase
MPELPEVETIVRELRQKMSGDVFQDIELRWPGSYQAVSGLSIKNRKITGLDRKGKYIIFNLQNEFLIVHLRMTGQIIVKKKLPADQKYLRVIFRMQSGRYLLFYDLRKFGRIILTDDRQNVLKNTGPDALQADFSMSYMLKRMQGKTLSVKSFLMDQRNVAGLGNIYIDESLYLARLHPESKAGKISRRQNERLYESIKMVLNGAIGRMGTTISDYKTTGGGFGENQNHLYVYGRGGEPCITCGSVIRKIKHNGRGTHFCPRCQKKIC